MTSLIRGEVFGPVASMTFWVKVGSKRSAPVFVPLVAMIVVQSRSMWKEVKVLAGIGTLGRGVSILLEKVY